MGAREASGMRAQVPRIVDTSIETVAILARHRGPYLGMASGSADSVTGSISRSSAVNVSILSDDTMLWPAADLLQNAIYKFHTRVGFTS